MQKSQIQKKLKEAYFYYRFLVPFKKKEHCGNENIMLFSTPRGGSTWLAEILQTVPKTALIWEPLFKYRKHKNNTINPFAYPEIHSVGFSWNQPIPENAEWDEAYSFFEDLLNKKIVNLKIYRFNNLSKINEAENFIYKFCFGNMLIDWFVKNFNHKTILFVRHPGAVIASQLKRGWNYTKKNPEYKVGNFKHNEVYLQYADILKTVKTPEENLAATWALTNLLPLMSHNNDKEWLTVAYENLYMNPENEIARISERLKITFPENILEQINTQSFTSNDKVATADKQKQLNKWKDFFTQKQIDNIFGIINQFNFEAYSQTDFMPNLNMIYIK